MSFHSHPAIARELVREYLNRTSPPPHVREARANHPGARPRPRASRVVLALAMTVLLGVALVAGAAAQTPSPTISFDRPCYAPGDPMTFQGAGYTPNGPVNLFFSTPGRYGSFDTAAAPDGNITGQIAAPDADDFLRDDEFAADVFVTSNDQTRIEQHAEPPESLFGTAQFRLSRWGVWYRSATGRIVANRRVTFRAVGFAHAIDRALYIHYRLRGRTVKTVKLGTLTGPCGDLTRSLTRAFPFRGVRPGTYTLVFNTSPRNPSERPSIEFPRVRVTGR